MVQCKARKQPEAIVPGVRQQLDPEDRDENMTRLVLEPMGSIPGDSQK